MKLSNRSLSSLRSTLIASALALASTATLHAQVLSGALNGGLAGRLDAPTPHVMDQVDPRAHDVTDRTTRGLDRAKTAVQSHASQAADKGTSTASNALDSAGSRVPTGGASGDASSAADASGALDSQAVSGRASGMASGGADVAGSAMNGSDVDAIRSTAQQTAATAAARGRNTAASARKRVSTGLDRATGMASAQGQQGLDEAKSAVSQAGTMGDGSVGADASGSADGSSSAHGGNGASASGNAQASGSARRGGIATSAQAGGNADAQAGSDGH